MKKQNLLLPIGILVSVIILGGSYVFVEYNKQHSIESQQKQKIIAESEIKRQEQKEIQRKKVEREELLDDCLNTAQEKYDFVWANSCIETGVLTKQCKDALELNINDYLDIYGVDEGLNKEIQTDSDKPLLLQIAEAFAQKQEECSCRLSSSVAERLDKNFKQDKEECFRRYSNN